MGKPDNNTALREKLAAIEHERWADWQSWVHQVALGVEGVDWDEMMERWQRQIDTPYEKLSDEEKASDMRQVDRYWHLVQEYSTARVVEELKHLDDSETGLFAVDKNYGKPMDDDDGYIRLESDSAHKWIKDRILELESNTEESSLTKETK